MNVRDEVSRVLARRDPLGLISIRALVDEYNPEARTIAARMREAMSVEEMRRIIPEKFVSWFSEEIAGPEARYDAVARDLWARFSRDIEWRV